VTGEEKCKLKDPLPNDCAILGCTHEFMDFRFNKTNLFGDATTFEWEDDQPTTEYMERCEVEDSGANDTVTYFDTKGDRVDVFLNSTEEYGYLHNMWKKSTGDCQSVITKDDDNEDIVITKTLVYNDTAQADDPINLLHNIYLFGNQGRVSIEFTCKFASSFTATSDDIQIEAGEKVEGKLETQGSWVDSLVIDFTNQYWNETRADGYSNVLGSTLYARISWSVSSALSQDLLYYVESCQVKQLTDINDGNGYKHNSGDGAIDIISNKTCTADVIDVALESNWLTGMEDWRFAFRSFSFTENGDDRQNLECEVKFCLNKVYKNSTDHDQPNECEALRQEPYVNNPGAPGYCEMGSPYNWQLFTNFQASDPWDV